MKEIRNRLIFALCVNVSTWVLVYAVSIFVRWELFNPFQWVIDMPKYEQGIRSAILFFIILYAVIIQIVYSEIFRKEVDDYDKRNRI